MFSKSEIGLRSSWPWL